MANKLKTELKEIKKINAIVHEIKRTNYFNWRFLLT